jgi:putative nucleotidyltransferase with HDIG domain
MVVIAVLPLWENLFDVISPLRLIELSHPANRLLKRLQVEAPGTYHHTLMVGTLAESAADRLGLNSLLVKAGAYYHDVGKLRRPHFFVENQFQGENVHDELSPTLSALIIVSHVREGMDLAAEHGLPRVIRKFITEHHGTTCLGYFHRKAKAMGEELPREQFCYPGPKPNSPETALVMLADSTEAAVRAAGGNIQDVVELEETVGRVIESKLQEKQLDDVAFTLKDLATIKAVFVDVLRSMYHSRQVKEIPKPAETKQEGSA